MRPLAHPSKIEMVPCFTQWCIVEMLAYIGMGGDTDQIRVIPVSSVDESQHRSGGTTSVDIGKNHDEVVRLVQLLRRFENFDVRRSKCTEYADHQRLMAVIEAGYGDVDIFNDVVKRTFADRM